MFLDGILEMDELYALCSEYLGMTLWSSLGSFRDWIRKRSKGKVQVHVPYVGKHKVERSVNIF